MNDFQRHKKSDKTKWAFTAIAFILAFVMIAGLCLQLFGSDKLKPSEWFKKSEQTEELPEENNGENMDSSFVATSYESGISLMSETRATNTYRSSYILTATVLPEDADNKLVDWTYDWENPNSAWASGKNVKDYFSVTTVTPVYVEYDDYGDIIMLPTYPDVSELDGTYLSVNAKIKEAFGEPVVVTVRSQDDGTKYATKTFGYMKRVEEINLELQCGGQKVTTVMFGDNQMYTLGYNCTYSEGTATPDISFTVSAFFLPGSFSEYDIVDVCGSSVTISNGSFVCSDNFYQNFFSSTITVKEFKEYAEKRASGWGFGPLSMTLSVTVTISSDLTTNLYKDKVSKSFNFGVDVSFLKVSVTDVTIDGDQEYYF